MLRRRAESCGRKAASKLWVDFAGELLYARDKGICKKELAKLSGVKKSVIDRMETFDIDPKISAVLKVLGVFGKTLAIVPIEEALKEPSDDSQQTAATDGL